MGIPNKGDLDDDDNSIKTKMAETIGIPKNHVWIFKNYTLESHEEDVDRSIELLDFILHCLTVAKENQQFRDSQKEKEQIIQFQISRQKTSRFQISRKTTRDSKYPERQPADSKYPEREPADSNYPERKPADSKKRKNQQRRLLL